MCINSSVLDVDDDDDNDNDIYIKICLQEQQYVEICTNF